ncbi:hypothetical protein N431DRAFT_521181 [Stipitochalara longipes BDJ]|nr:hypothetical protein N431DRAFT_521181 [Stipitochalara longipes BDJ]
MLLNIYENHMYTAKMEPLSITMAVIGLLKTANEVSSGIARFVSSKNNGSKEIRDVKTTVDTLRSVLLQLQLLLLNHGKIDERRSSMILVDELVATLTACVMTFSDLDSCVEGLESDERLGILGSVRWASKSAELRRYERNLEAHKTSLGLIVNILSCQSAHNLANDAAELKVMMVRVLNSNKALAERMSMLESVQWQHSPQKRRDYKTASAFGQDTIAEPDADIPESFVPEAPKGHPAFTFEEDLSKSWVYQRSLIRGPRTFSIASSKRLTQVTQSWSVLSGISLSQISNIAVQSLPIFQDDLKDNHLYDFGTVDHELRMNPDYLSFLLSKKEPQNLRKRPATQNFYSEPSSSQPTASRTYSNQNPQETEKNPKIDEESPDKSKFLLPELDFSFPAQEISLSQHISQVEAKIPVSVLPHSNPESKVTASKVPDTTFAPTRPSWRSNVALFPGDVLYIAASLFRFDIPVLKYEAGYQYLMYMAGEGSSSCRRENYTDTTPGF